MRSILVAGRTEASVRRSVSVAADLSVACGARLGLAWISHSITPAASASDGQLSDQLFQCREWYKPIPSFAAARVVQPDWLREMREIVEEDWGEVAQGGLAALTQRIDKESPGLVIACESNLARVLIDETSAPVWHVRAEQVEPEWLSLRRLRCSAQGLRAVEWAHTLAASLGADLEFADRGNEPDMAVLTRGLRGTLKGLVLTRSTQPLIIVV